MGVRRRQLKKFVVAEQKSKKIFPPGESRLVSHGTES
jgi:hypothetical protein